MYWTTSRTMFKACLLTSWPYLLLVPLAGSALKPPYMYIPITTYSVSIASMCTLTRCLKICWFEGKRERLTNDTSKLLIGRMKHVQRLLFLYDTISKRYYTLKAKLIYYSLQIILSYIKPKCFERLVNASGQVLGIGLGDGDLSSLTKGIGCGVFLILLIRRRRVCLTQTFFSLFSTPFFSFPTSKTIRI